MALLSFFKISPRGGKGPSGITTKKCHLFVAQANCPFRGKVVVPNCVNGSLNLFFLLANGPIRVLKIRSLCSGIYQELNWRTAY